MSRGNFAAAEANLRRYAFIAPDQANPHDSLGELYTLIGRWDDAERELRQALEINPRFVAAYEHLARLAALRGDAEAAERYVVQAVDVGEMSDGDVAGLRAAVRGWAALSRGDVVSLRQAVTDPAIKGGDLDLALLRVIAAGRSGDAAGARAAWEASREAWPGLDEKGSAPVRAMFDLMEAVVLLTEGRAAAAVDATTKADEKLTYNADMGEGILKLVVRLFKVEALAGDARTRRAACWRGGGHQSGVPGRDRGPSGAGTPNVDRPQRLAPGTAETILDLSLVFAGPRRETEVIESWQWRSACSMPAPVRRSLPDLSPGARRCRPS
jgi:hypothetical protein